MKKTEKKSWLGSGILLPGFMFLGIGIGVLLDEPQTGLFIGMGIGFISMGIVKLLSHENSDNKR